MTWREVELVDCLNKEVSLNIDDFVIVSCDTGLGFMYSAELPSRCPTVPNSDFMSAANIFEETLFINNHADIAYLQEVLGNKYGKYILGNVVKTEPTRLQVCPIYVFNYTTDLKPNKSPIEEQLAIPLSRYVTGN